MAKEPQTLGGKVVAITGAARGIGRATAQALAAKGMAVAIGDIDLDLAQRTAEELGAGVIALEVDVTERASVASFLDSVESQLGPLDVLVNNAGIMHLGRLLVEADETAQRMLDININGVLYGVKEVLPRFLARGSGHLVNIASAAGKTGFAGGATYSGTKHFVVGMSEALRVELHGTAINVSVVMPSVVETELAAGLPRVRGVRNVRPEEVAAAIVRALEHPRFDVYVPRTVGPITTVTSLLPRRARDVLAHALRAEQVLDVVDTAARREYEERAARSASRTEV